MLYYVLLYPQDDRAGTHETTKGRRPAAFDILGV